MLYNENTRNTQLMPYKTSVGANRGSRAEMEVAFMHHDNCEQLISFIHTLFLERALVHLSF